MNIRTLFQPRKLLRYGLGRIIYQPRVDSTGRPQQLSYLGRLNQHLMESGQSPPWIMSREECIRFWRQEAQSDPGNRPEEYAGKESGIVDLIRSIWSPHVSADESILELGCNAGGNLRHLHAAGYKNLTGIEINPVAVGHMRNNFPALSAIPVIQGSLEEVLPQLASHSVDVILTMAVLIHLHPESHWVLRDMTRIARRYLCLVECEVASCDYVFPRNYSRVFESLGCETLKRILINRDSAPHVSPIYDGYFLYLFKVGGGLRDSDTQRQSR